MNLKTEVLFILDKSGSMNSIKSDAIGGYNAFIDEQKKLEDDTKFSLFLFDSNYQKIYESVSLSEIKSLDESTYIPSSMTALYDAIGITIEESVTKYNKLSDNEKPDRVLCVILTDGENNKSTKYTREAIFEMIDERRKNDWEFIFLAAGQDAMKVASSMNIDTSNSYNFSASSDGMSDVFQKVSCASTLYRSSSAKKMKFNIK
jgi:hypothetical protein